MRILFIGGTQRGYLTLQALVERAEQVVGIISLRQHPHEVERYEKPIKDLGRLNCIPVYETGSFKDRDYVELLEKELRPDVAFVVGCRVLIPKRVYAIPKLGTLGVHDSPLPEYRGFAPLNWAILNGEDHTGVTLFHLDEKMDGGDIAAQKMIKIGPTDTAPEVYERVCMATVDLIMESLPLLKQGVAPRNKQEYDVGSFTCSRAPVDGYIDWRATTAHIYNQVRALTYPYPGAFTYYRRTKVTVWKAAPHPSPPRYVGRVPGRVMGVEKARGFVDVLTGDGILRIVEIQTEDRGRMLASEFIDSIREKLGEDIPELLDRINKLEEDVANLQEALSR